MASNICSIREEGCDVVYAVASARVVALEAQINYLEGTIKRIHATWNVLMSTSESAKIYEVTCSGAKYNNELGDILSTLKLELEHEQGVMQNNAPRKQLAA
jgi:hypothetical protein